MTLAENAFDMGELDAAEAIAAADAALAALAEEYPNYAAADVEAMQADILALLARFDGVSDSEISSPEVQSIFSVAHNVKGQGASFGYELMTTLGEALCGLLRGQTSVTLETAVQAAALIEACDEVLKHRLCGEGGARGLQLMQGLGLPADQSH